MSCTSEVPRPSSAAICRLDRFRPMKERHNTQIRNGWWCPASTVPLRSSKRDAHAWQRYRCRCGCVSSCPFRTTASLSHPGQRTPSGQRCWRTKAKHFASSSRDARLTGSTVAMMTGPPCSPATADRLKPSSYLNPPPQASITPEADKSHLGYHAHIYYGSASTRTVAERVCAALSGKFPVEVEGFRDTPRGPHPIPN